jgi:hypothetical protein
MRAGLMPQDDVKRQDISKLPPATTIAWMQRTGYLQKRRNMRPFFFYPNILGVRLGSVLANRGG